MKTLIFWACLLFAGGLLAHSLPLLKYQLSGYVNSGGDPLEYATVSAYDLDSNLIDGTVTDAAGYFTLKLPPDTYRIKVDFIGLEAQEIIHDLKAKAELPPIELQPANLKLETVEVTAEKTKMQLALNKKIFNIGKDALAQGGSATNALEQLPSVEVSVEGAVSLRGNAGVRILINGRPSALADNNALESIPADQIERVEIITNPSAKYEASGTAGIINIILKNSANQGYGGTVNLTTGIPNNHRLSTNLNLRRKKFSAFASVGLRLSNYEGSGELTRSSELAGNFSRLARNIVMPREDRNLQAFGGFDYNFDDKTTLTFSYSLYHVVNDDESNMDFRLFNADFAPLENWQQYTDYLEPQTFQQIDLTLVKQLHKEGEKLTFYFKNDLGNETENENISIEQTFPAAINLVNYRTQTLEGNRDHLLQADYEVKVAKNGKFEGGLRGETRVISADYRAETPDSNGDYELVPGFENEFDYFERIGSAYAQYGWEPDKWSFQVGLRTEYTFIKVENMDENMRDFDKDYLRFFPSFSATHRLSEVNSLQLSYSRRIRRPRFWQLNPFAGIENPTRLFRGNPDLDPSYSDNIEFGYLSRGDKFTFNPSVYVVRTLDVFAPYYDEVAGNIFDLNSSTITETQITLPLEYRYGLELNTTYRPTEKLSFNTTLNYYGFTQEGQFLEQDYDYEFATWNARLRTNLSLGKTIQFNASAMYIAPVETAQQVSAPRYFIDLGGSKRWGDRVTISANARSPRFMKSVTRATGFERDEYFQWTRWRASLSFQYRFEQGAGSGARRQRGSIR